MMGGGIGGGFDPMPMGPGGMMFTQPEGFNDLHPDLPDGQDPLRIGPVRRPGMMNPMGGPNLGGGMFGPGGNLRGNFGPGGQNGPGGNMYM